LNTRERSVARETSWIVFSGTVINYPLQLLCLWVIIDHWDITSAFWIGTYTTLMMTVFAWLRVYAVRDYHDRKEKRKRMS
jgi:hypothetical protein